MAGCGFPKRQPAALLLLPETADHQVLLGSGARDIEQTLILLCEPLRLRITRRDPTR